MSAPQFGPDVDAMDDAEQTPPPPPPGSYLSPSHAETESLRWKRKMDEGTLGAADFRNYWRVTVPWVYSPEPNGSCLSWNFDEDRASALLLSPLEKFICGGEDPQEALPKLAQLDSAPSVCGRVFKMGEPAYSCRECGIDNTCVLCVDCFKLSPHRHHKYKMGTSAGGGCCDCGDVEAWRSEPHCDVHAAGTLPREVPQGLPEDLVARTGEVFSAALGYCYQLLTLDNSPCLPNDLRLKSDGQHPLLELLEHPDNFCTVLYNDETHTFEQVITTLTKVIKCSHRDAIEYVTNIDREGRAVVKCASLHHCNDLKLEIEKYTARHGNRSLKVHVVHAHVIGHQIFAMKLLQWIQNFVAHAEGFRRILSETALARRAPDAPVAEGVLLHDCQLWKAARTAWHRLLIAGMLMDYDSKKALATVFTKNYGSVIKDYIRDDHDHAFSVSSLSVQIYTVPTLAHHLIAHEDALFILLNTFLSECSRKRNGSGKLEFERNASNTTFKRAQFILYDLKYLLSVKPDVWTDALRKGFLQGLSLVLNLLTMMQGMDAIARQVGQHMEFEPEWESAFNLHIKLATVITLALEWCGTDRVVLVKAYRAALRQLHNNQPPNEPAVLQELADHCVSCVSYDVSHQPVSIHLPLSRFLAGLHLHLHKFGLNFDSPEFQMAKPSLEQIIEPVLRTQAMVAQVHAGMWRRNGYALLNQLYFYHNVKCRSEMLDRDIVQLQIGASLLESNEFLIHALNKFNLIGWAQLDFEEVCPRNPEEDSMRMVINLVEEFLGLLITIVAERYTPGVGECTVEDKTKKEIIQQLCCSSLSHSELNRTLPEDQLHETGMENVIEEVAEFKKPASGKGCGAYSLKPHLYSEYNVFFYHYTREELSKSEEVQRKRRKNAGELECCPPPKLPELTHPFTMLADLMQCDVMIYILRIVLARSADLTARSFSEMQLHKALHLIGMALQEQESGRYSFFKFTDRASRCGILELLSDLQKSARVDAHRDLITWTLNKYREVASSDEDTTPSAQTPETNLSEPSAESSVRAESEKERRAKLAAQQRARVMAHMQAMQNNFMKENAKLFEDVESSQGSAQAKDAMEVNVSFEPEAIESATPKKPVRERRREAPAEANHTCILCQEDTTVSVANQPLVLAGFVQRSTVLLQNKNGELPPTVAVNSPCLPSSVGPAPHVSTCGHVMHGSCWQKYYNNVVHKETRRPYRLRQPAVFNVDKQEFLCPLCDRLSNTVLPLVPSLTSLRSWSDRSRDSDLSFREWIEGVRIVLNHRTFSSIPGETNEEAGSARCFRSGDPAFYESHVKVVVHAIGEGGERFASAFPADAPEFDEDYRTFIQMFATAMSEHGSPESSHVTVAWAGAAYTLLVVETVSEASSRPLLGHLPSRHRDCLQALIRLIGVLGNVIAKRDSVGGHALQLLSPFLSTQNRCEFGLLDWDAFGYLVALSMSAPSAFAGESESCPVPTDSALGSHVGRLAFTVQVVKAMLLVDLSDCASEAKMEDGICGESDGRFLELLKRIRRNADALRLDAGLAWSAVRGACKTYLRSACLFLHFLEDIEAPPSLVERDGDSFENMCAFAGLPRSFDEIFDSPEMFELALSWSSRPDAIAYLSEENAAATPLYREPRPPCKLIALPDDYSELINAASLFACPNSDREDSRNPTMCLVCGKTLCSQSYCCQTELNKSMVGACTYHAYACGAGVGVFLRVRECEILLLAVPSKGCVVPPPYVDRYGETDQGLRRGNPLRLCRETYEKLQMVWLNHGIQEEIARSIEVHAVTPTWQHL